ncbi:hypothetical protein AB6A40_009291 [Gnathostoma spinigerum]|uniref:Uncharacterized protein n=1 Tax=Gnathostoma spinigerum TaxID=75299 RepID=A0ABD6F0J5_9BILA
MTSEVTCGIFLILFTETSLIAGGTLVRAEETPSKKCINGDVCTLKDEETLRFLIIGDTGGLLQIFD